MKRTLLAVVIMLMMGAFTGSVIAQDTTKPASHGQSAEKKEMYKPASKKKMAGKKMAPKKKPAKKAPPKKPEKPPEE